jgi:hypothetical protein
MKYLVVKFYDNDFGTPMLAALARLWGYIDGNDRAYSQPQYMNVTQVFEKLLECGAFQPMLLRLFVLENLCSDVEGKTRGLHNWHEWSAEKAMIDKPSHLEPDTYLSCDVAIYGQYENIPDIDWANGECAYLNLTTGEVGTF